MLTKFYLRTIVYANRTRKGGESMSDFIDIQQEQEANEAVRRFAELPAEKQQAALLILRGIQIGEELAAAQDKSA